MFERYCHSFPADALKNPEFKACCGALALYQDIMSYNLQETFSETVRLLNILITTPMTTAEAVLSLSLTERERENVVYNSQLLLIIDICTFNLAEFYKANKLS